MPSQGHPFLQCCMRAAALTLLNLHVVKNSHLHSKLSIILSLTLLLGVQLSHCNLLSCSRAKNMSIFNYIYWSFWYPLMWGDCPSLFTHFESFSLISSLFKRSTVLFFKVAGYTYILYIALFWMFCKIYPSHSVDSMICS